MEKKFKTVNHVISFHTDVLHTEMKTVTRRLTTTFLDHHANSSCYSEHQAACTNRSSFQPLNPEPTPHLVNEAQRHLWYPRVLVPKMLDNNNGKKAHLYTTVLNTIHLITFPRKDYLVGFHLPVCQQREDGV